MAAPFASSATFRTLDAALARAGEEPAARATLARWAAAEPALAAFASPGELVRRCREGRDRRAANDVLAAVLRHAAGDPVAQHTAVHLSLPGLAAAAARRPGPQLHDGPWDDDADLDWDLVARATEAVAEAAGSAGADLPWPANALVSRAREAARTAAQAHRRRQRRELLAGRHGGALVDAVAPPERPVAEALAAALADAVAARRLRPRDAKVVYATRVLGYRPEEVARAQGRDVRALLKQRERAEKALVGA